MSLNLADTLLIIFFACAAVTTVALVMMRLGWLPRQLPTNMITVHNSPEFSSIEAIQGPDAELPGSVIDEIEWIVTNRFVSQPVEYPKRLLADLENTSLPA